MMSYSYIHVLLYLIGGYAFVRAKRPADFLILLTFIQFTFLAVNILEDVHLKDPFCALIFLNGPLLYLIYSYYQGNPVSNRHKLVHFIPFLIILVIDGLARMLSVGHTLTLASLFQIIYAAWIFGRQQQAEDVESPTATLIKQLSILLTVNGVINILIYLNASGMPLELGFNVSLLCYLSALLLMALTIRELILDRKSLPFISQTEGLPDSGQAQEPYKYSILPLETLNEIESRIKEHLLEHKVYLQPDLTMDDFSAQIQVSKNNLSQVLNVHMGKSFYRLLAEQRIAYALERLEKNKNLKIEALAYDCGFNSLSTFNRYFKEIMGIQPSAYIKSTTT